MSSQIEDELRATFEAASDFVQPRSALADSVRNATRRRRRRLTAAFAAATACVLVAAGGAYGAVHSRTSPLVADEHGRVFVTVPRGESLVSIAVGGRYLYAEMITGQNGPASVAAYDRASGRLAGRFTFPKADLVQVSTGPGGAVWAVVGPLSNFGPVRIWLLSPDLRLHSIGPKVQSTFSLPVGPTTALVPVAGGLLRLTMPAPGQPGHATEHLEPGTGLGRGVMTLGSGWAQALDGRVAVDLPDNDGYDYHVVIAGHPSIRYGNALIPQPAAVAGDSLWLANTLGRPLVRLNGQLEPTTPGFVTADPALQNVSSVSSADGTIWVESLRFKHFLAFGAPSLVCFPAQSQDGPVVTLPVHGYILGLASAGRTVYLAMSRSLKDTPRSITSYPVPAACR
jgi:hypothetical protein